MDHVLYLPIDIHDITVKLTCDWLNFSLENFSCIVVLLTDDRVCNVHFIFVCHPESVFALIMLMHLHVA